MDNKSVNKEPTKVKIKMRIKKEEVWGANSEIRGNTHEIEMRMPTRNTHAIQEEFQWT